MKALLTSLLALAALCSCGQPKDFKYYSYAPAIIQTQGLWHEYFCSKGAQGSNDWDDIRHATSTDLTNWTEPQDYLTPVAYERSNCDPSVVRFDAGDGLFYYMFYGGAVVNVQTVIFVARATEPTGPFLKWTQRHTWEYEPQDPQVIIAPFTANPEGAPIYGAGQPTIIVRNGRLLMWYLDDTAPPPNDFDLIYYTSSTNATDWTPPTVTNVSNQSIDVKFDAITNLFVLFEITNMHDDPLPAGTDPSLDSYLDSRTSIDGITWTDPHTLCTAGCFPGSGSNLGVSSDDQGQLIPGSVVIRYAIPDATYQFVLTTFWPPQTSTW